MAKSGVPKATLAEYEERFWSRVRKRKNGCWEWQGGRFSNESGVGIPNYGAFWFYGRTIQAHRVAYFFEHGTWPKLLCHECDNPPCVRLGKGHVVRGSHKDNSEHMVAVGRAAIGLRNGKYTKPDRTPRGDRSPARKHPELYRGERNGQSKLTDRDVRKIRRLRAKGLSQQSIADRFGVHQTLIGFIVRGEAWKHVK